MAGTGKPTNDYLFPIMVSSGLYYVDILGRVWTTKKFGGQSLYTDRWRRAEVAGPKRSQVRHNGILVYANRFVWYWFNGEIPEGIEIDHKNNDKMNNHPDNLQPLTRLENQQKAERDGLINRIFTEQRKQNLSLAAKLAWANPVTHDRMVSAAKRGWEKRRAKQQ